MTVPCSGESGCISGFSGRGDLTAAAFLGISPSLKASLRALCSVWLSVRLFSSRAPQNQVGGIRIGVGRVGDGSIRAIHPWLSTRPVRPAARPCARSRSLRLVAPDPVVDRRGDRVRSLVEHRHSSHPGLRYPHSLSRAGVLQRRSSSPGCLSRVHRRSGAAATRRGRLYPRVAALFNPLRRRIKSFIDRRFYRSKYAARKTLEAFAATLSNETDLDALSDDLVTVVRRTMHPTHVSLWLRPETGAKGEQTVRQ
jgi:hypothetical protein